jgi:hypothetical protein
MLRKKYERASGCLAFRVTACFCCSVLPQHLFLSPYFPPRYEHFFPDEVRTDLFSLFSKWCATFGGPSPDGVVVQVTDMRLAFIALQAIAALCRGPLFDFAAAIANDGYFCRWLVTVMACDNPDARQ